ncbi:hypothetical protein [Maribacter hydrothermalis]|uniref:Uncharacterized protein n=1 Tax=Maribacter hydrothermalis TaxID=1836467 RepID=A0A1B7Z1V8_9FLAO|nr:hypothetical protein [Maribacter hydrothermalis]APQ18322.1 hypothetical protein BTR34_13740 [Maribacter hydrothermalis]OBR36668.1 hypothetical protein A9200_09635 [Maribacter hydrothermalis]
MKSIILLTALFFTTFLVQAQANNENISVVIETVQVEKVQTIESNEFFFPMMETQNKIEVARLYKNKNNRIINALEFKTKMNNAKLS